MTDDIIKVAKDAGWTDLQIEMASPAERDRLARFWAIAYRAGMERAAEICDLDGQYRVATLIRAHKEGA